MLNNSDPMVREGTIKNLARIGSRDAAAVISRCLRDPDQRVRITACKELGQMRAHAAKSHLYDALHDPDKRIRVQAVELLSAIGLPTEAPSDREIYEANFDGTRRRVLMPPSGTLHAVITTMNGDIELELVPQGTLAERIRAGGAGISSRASTVGATSSSVTGTSTTPVATAPEGGLITRGT